MSHTCHAAGCRTEVPPKMFMCRPHWFRLPLDLRNAIWRAYKPGQEIKKNPSAEYLKVAEDAIALIAKLEGRPYRRIHTCNHCGSQDRLASCAARVEAYRTCGMRVCAKHTQIADGQPRCPSHWEPA